MGGSSLDNAGAGWHCHHQGGHRPRRGQVGVSLRPPRTEEPPDHGSRQVTRAESLPFQPATQVRHQMDLLRRRPRRIAAVEQLLASGGCSLDGTHRPNDRLAPWYRATPCPASTVCWFRRADRVRLAHSRR